MAQKFGPITIDFDKCTGCGNCAEDCPMEVYDEPVDGKTVVARPEDCTQCMTCVNGCPEEAITVDED